jgi:predicted Rossmann fold flavoprotein
MKFFQEAGVKLKVERGDRVFPESDKSSDIINAFKSELDRRKVNIKLNSNVAKINANNNHIHSVELDNGELIQGDYFIITTGGLSYPRTGSTGDGLLFAEQLGHKIIKPRASVVPLVIEEEWVKELQGLSLKNVELSIIDNRNKVLFKDFGEMLFTHFGISGPIVLSSSTVVKDKSNLKAVINLKPALTFEELDKRLQADFSKYSNKDFKNSLDDLLPQKLINTVIKLSNIEEDKKVNLITREERRTLATLLQKFTLSIKGLRPIEEAIVTAGGVDVKQIDPSTMKSKQIDNLHFAGEVLDVDAYTGGYNIQIALSTGYLAGIKAGEVD